jgi:integrase
MKNHHPENERIKRDYLAFLREAKGRSDASVDSVAAAIHLFEEYTHFRDFKAFHREQAKGFKRALGQRLTANGKPLSKATLHTTVRQLRAFFVWLAAQHGYRAKLSYSDADYFNLQENDARIATARRDRPGPTLEQVLHVLGRMPWNTAIERRDRALIAFALLSGARDGALASLRLKHVDLSGRRVEQDAREVATKRRKSFSAWFFPVGDEPLRIVTEWIGYLRGEMQWGDDDPLFPRTKVAPGPNRAFQAVGLARDPWTNAGPIRTIFREAFEGAGLPYFNPHSLRKTLVQLAMQLKLDPEAFRAWSQNLGHEQVLTTFTAYGTVAPDRQAELMRDLAFRAAPDPKMEDAVRSFLRMMQNSKALKSPPATASENQAVP